VGQVRGDSHSDGLLADTKVRRPTDRPLADQLEKRLLEAPNAQHLSIQALAVQRCERFGFRLVFRQIGSHVALDRLTENAAWRLFPGFHAAIVAGAIDNVQDFGRPETRTPCDGRYRAKRSASASCSPSRNSRPAIAFLAALRAPARSPAAARSTASKACVTA